MPEPIHAAPTPVVRLATLDDLEHLVDFRIRMQTEVNPAESARADAAYADAVREYFARAIPAGAYASAVAEADGEVIAAAGLVVYERPPSLLSRATGVGYLSNVYTVPEWRRQGIADTLVRFILEHARTRGIGTLQLAATEHGMGIYTRAGFKHPRFPILECSLKSS